MWKYIDGYGKDYCVSDSGDVYSVKRHKFMVLSKDKDGYSKVKLRKNGNQKLLSVHRLVAEAFIENPENKPQVNHKNGNKNDNRAENLEWCTASENIKHAFETGLKVANISHVCGEKNGNHKLSNEDVEYIKEHFVLHDKEFGCRPLARKFGVMHSTIRSIVNGNTWK